MMPIHTAIQSVNSHAPQGTTLEARVCVTGLTLSQGDGRAYGHAAPTLVAAPHADEAIALLPAGVGAHGRFLLGRGVSQRLRNTRQMFRENLRPKFVPSGPSVLVAILIAEAFVICIVVHLRGVCISTIRNISWEL